jgi:hypothetical protein
MVLVDNSAQALVMNLSWYRSRSMRRSRLSVLGVLLAAIAWTVAALACALAARAQTPVDLELVIAVDVSLSMDLEEQRLQRDGYVAAFRDAEIHKAIAAGPHGRITVTYVEWAGPASQRVVIPWTIIDGPDAARAFAEKLEGMPISRARLTSISSALKFSQELFAGSGAKTVRRVIDVSGDGPNNAGLPVVPVRDEIVAGGTVINGLPIMFRLAVYSAFDIPDLDRYYASCVIGGTGAFMVPVKDIAEFASAIRRKLLLEISGAEQPLRLIPVQNAADDYDCMSGEKRWRWYQDRQQQ